MLKALGEVVQLEGHVPRWLAREVFTRLPLDLRVSGVFCAREAPFLCRQTRSVGMAFASWTEQAVYPLP